VITSGNGEDGTMDGVRTVRDVMYQRLDRPGAETVWVEEHHRGWSIVGSVAVVLDDEPVAVTYRVEVDKAWQTLNAEVTQRLGSGANEVHIAVVDGVWTVAGEPRPDLSGCVDIDLGVSPITNTLPIRRLNLEPGGTAEVGAAWVQFPSLEIRRLYQRYTLIDTKTFRYESDTGFRADLTVDTFGVVRNYPGLWTAAAVTPSDQEG